MNRRLLTAAGCLLLAVPLAAQPLTLRDAAREALTRNPRVAAAESDVAAARARHDAARSSWLPLIDAAANATRSNNPVFVFGSLLEQGRFGQRHFDPQFLNDPPALTNTRLSVDVRYALFDPVRRFDASPQDVTRSQSAAEEMRQQLLADVIARFYGLTVAEQRRAVAAEAVRAAEAAAKATRDKAEQGLVVDSDRLAAEVQLAQFRQEAIAAEGDASIARAALAVTLQRPLMSRFEIEATLPDRTFVPIELSAAIEQALKTRGEIAMAGAARAAAELQLRGARGSLLPRLDAFVSIGASRGNSDHAIGVVARIGVFDNTKYARIAEARAGADAARAIETMTRDKVAMETITAWNRANAARQQLDVVAAAVVQAEAAARIVQDRYDNGLTTITELLRAQTALVGARLSLISARHQSITGYAELLRSIGGLREIDPFL